MSTFTYPEIWRCASPAFTTTFPTGDAASSNCGVHDTADLYGMF